MTEYYIPTGPGEAEYDEKRSRFLAHLRYVESEDEAKAFIAEMKKKYYDARHNCWCYIIKDGPERYSDDGEPQGTAGIPMLEMFRHENITSLVCVVTRYFGGVLLGTGGLLRAYTKAAKDSLEDAGVSVVRRWIECSVNCPYAFFEKVKNEISAVAGVCDNIDYSSLVSLSAFIPEENYPSFCASLTDLSAGSITPEMLGEMFKAVPLQ